MDRLCSAFIVWLRDRVMREGGGQPQWELIVAELDTPPPSRHAPVEDEPVRPAALPPGAPVGAVQESAAFDAFAGALGRRG